MPHIEINTNTLSTITITGNKQYVSTVAKTLEATFQELGVSFPAPRSNCTGKYENLTYDGCTGMKTEMGPVYRMAVLDTMEEIQWKFLSYGKAQGPGGPLIFALLPQ